MAEPNPKQTLILWALLAHGGAAAQKGLGLTLDAKDRKALEAAGLLAVQRGKRGAINLEVTDKGWNWAGENLGAVLPAGRNATKAGTQILQTWLQRLQGYMRTSGVSLAEILAGHAEPPKPPEATAPPPTLAYPELRERIRSAYLELAGGFSKDGVPLSQIRRKLDGIERGAVDAALRRMHEEDGGTTLMGLDNPREIAAEGDAALAFKGEQLHVLWVTR